MSSARPEVAEPPGISSASMRARYAPLRKTTGLSTSGRIISGTSSTNSRTCRRTRRRRNGRFSRSQNRVQERTYRLTQGYSSGRMSRAAAFKGVIHGRISSEPSQFDKEMIGEPGQGRHRLQEALAAIEPGEEAGEPARQGLGVGRREDGPDRGDPRSPEGRRKRPAHQSDRGVADGQPSPFAPSAPEAAEAFP